MPSAEHILSGLEEITAARATIAVAWRARFAAIAVPLFDTTEIHASAAVDYTLA